MVALKVQNGVTVQVDVLKEVNMNFNQCMTKPLSRMKTSEIKACTNKLLYNPVKSQTDRELLSVIILRSKEHHLDFLQGFTKIKAIGTWQDVKNGRIIKTYPDERNTKIEVEFRDTKKETVGNRLMDIFTKLNDREIGEELLYCRTEPIEESTL